MRYANVNTTPTTLSYHISFVTGFHNSLSSLPTSQLWTLWFLYQSTGAYIRTTLILESFRTGVLEIVELSIMPNGRPRRNCLHP